MPRLVMSRRRPVCAERNRARNNVHRCLNMPVRQQLGTLEARRRRFDRPVATRRGVPSARHVLAIALLHLLLVGVTMYDKTAKQRSI